MGSRAASSNRPGEATVIGADIAAKSSPDGYAVLLGDNATYAVNPSLYPKLSYDPMKDLVPVSLTARFALMLVVGASVPAKSVPELVAMGKASDIAYASQGTGSPHHLAMEMLRQRAPLRLTHVPYRGSAPAVNDLLSGLVPTMFLDLGTASQHIRSGKIRVLAVSSPKRLKDWPDVPTLAESGFPGYEAWAWQGLSVLAATPKAVVERLQAAYLKAAADPTNRQRIIDKGGEILTSTPDEMRAYMQAETVKWSRLVREAKTKVD